MTEEKKELSRREFLSGAGLAFAAGALALAACAPQEPEGVVQECPQPEPCPDCDPCPECEAATVEVAAEMPPVPWGFAELDVELARKRGHQGYYDHLHCSGGAFFAILEGLKETVGFPYTQVPKEMMTFGKGGFVGWGTLCGALNGAAAAMNLVVPYADLDMVINELAGWYTEAELPSAEINAYAANGELLAEKTLPDDLPRNAAGSVLCHASVTNWCRVAGISAGSPARSERCGRLAGDVAAKAAELLNAYKAGTFKAAYALPEGAATCVVCHKKGDDFEAGNFVMTKMECTSCHDSHD